jgi:tetratricopeptide (TPR) repeat protein/DNA-binding XRE family transcriptional regulator
MERDYLPVLGTLLRRYRRGLGMTQQELATAAGYSEVYVGMLERGQRVPSSATIEALAEALALDLHQRASLIAAARTSVLGASPSALVSATAPPVAAGTQLVGRTREMALVKRQLERAGTHLLTVAGEPGIGKTRLLQEAVRFAPSVGWTVLMGTTPLLSAQEPFSPLLGVLERYVQSQVPAKLQRELEGCIWLVRLLPELVEFGVAPPPDWKLSVEQERRLMFKAARRFLANVAGPAGTLVVLDDIQWASPDAIDLLAHLLHTPAEVPLHVVLAYRSTDMHPEDPLSRLLTSLTRTGEASRLELGPLGRDEAEELLGSVWEGTSREGERSQLVDQVLHRAGGMPLFLVSFAQMLQTAGSADERAMSEVIPRDIQDGMRQRVAVLSKQARELLAVSAAVGQQVPRMLLMSIMTGQGYTEGEVLTALEATCSARLLVEEGDDRYGFSHDLVREAIMVDLSAARRALLHRQVAEALEHTIPRPSAEVLAYHYVRAGEPARAVSYLERAGDHAMALRAHMQAGRFYQELAMQLDMLGRPEDATKAREKLGNALMTAAQYDAALGALDMAATTYLDERNLEGQVRVMAHVGEVHALRGTSEEGIERLERFLGAIEHDQRPSRRGLAALHATLAWLINTTGRYTEALRVAHQAAELARSADDPGLLLQANLREGHLLLMLEEVDQGVSLLEEAVPQAEAVGDLRGLRFALNSLGWIHELRGNFEQDRMYTERAFHVAQQLGDPTVLAFMQSNRGSPAFNQGDWRRAREDFEAGLAQMRLVKMSWAAAWPPLLLGQLCLAEGRQSEGVDLLQEALDLAERNKDLEALRWAHGALAERNLVMGEPEAARARLLPLLDRPGQREIDVCALLPLLAWAHADLDEVEEAEAVTRDALARASAAGMRPTIASVLHARARVAQRKERWEQARADLEQAIELSRGMRYPYGEAKLLYALGKLFLQRQECDIGRLYLARALDILSRLGEELYAHQVRVALHAAEVG